MASFVSRLRPSRSEDTQHHDGASFSTEAYNEPDSSSGIKSPTGNQLSKFVLYFMAIHFLQSFCEIILVAPLIKLFENSLCLNHYGFPPGGVEEALCKIPEIQQPLATIRGWKSTFDALPGISNPGRV